MCTTTEMELKSFMMEYIPYQKGVAHEYDSQTLVYVKSGTVYDPNRKYQFCSRIKEWLTKETLNGVDGRAAIVIAMAPGHKAGSSHSFLSEIIAEIVQANPLKLRDGRTLLQRTATVRKATDGGPRDTNLHMQTIEVTDPESVRGRVVYIVDDVWTTGATLTACRNLMVKAGAKEIKLLAVAKTKYYGYPEAEDFEM